MVVNLDTIWGELAEAGLPTGTDLSIGADGSLTGTESLSPEDRAILDRVLAAHNPGAPSAEAVTAERDRRLDAGFTFNGVRFQTRPRDRENIAGAAQMATLAIVLHGAQPGDLRWHGGATDFTWIAEDNSLVPMDAPTVITFGQAAGTRHAAIIMAAREIKDRVVTGEALDITSDALWPA